MENEKKAAYEYAANCLFAAAESLREGLDTIDLDGLDLPAAESLEKVEEALTKAAQMLQRKAKEGPAIQNGKRSNEA